MALPLSLIYLPTPDIDASLAFYRDLLGFDESWREGDDTVGLAVPDSDLTLMLDRVADLTAGGPGPMFVVDDLAGFLTAHPALVPALGPMEIPDGSLVGLQDPAGNWLYVLDQRAAG